MSNNTYNRASLLIQKAKGPKWKRELVSDHKFDFIDIEEFRDRTCLLTIRYFILLCSVLVSCAVYCADLGSAGILLIYDRWSLSTQPKIPFYISKWIYVGCIAISFMLLAWEIRKTRNVMETRDISLAVTNPLAYKTYSVKSYSHFCLLQKIKNSTRWSDVIIFYVFYTLKGWKKIIVAQGPRQIIAGITVYALLKSAWTDPTNGQFKFSSDWDTYGQDWPQRVSLMLMSFTCILWIFSALQIVLAVLLYFPILCQIQGNLKEYCCYKIDKRIDELLEKQRKKRIREREKYAHSIASKKSKKSTKKGLSNQNETDLIPALPTLPIINNVDLYAGEKKSHPWLYQQPEQQNSYYDSQPLTPLESAYSLQRNNTKYNPYNETPYLPPQPSSNMYSQQQQQDIVTNNYYYPGAVQPHYSTYSASNTVYSNASNGNNKPHEYDVPLKVSRNVVNDNNNNNLDNNNNIYNKSNHYQPVFTTKNHNTETNSPLYSNSSGYLQQPQQQKRSNNQSSSNKDNKEIVIDQLQYHDEQHNNASSISRDGSSSNVSHIAYNNDLNAHQTYYNKNNNNNDDVYDYQDDYYYGNNATETLQKVDKHQPTTAYNNYI